MRYFFIILAFIILAAVSFLGLPGSKFQQAPLWIFPDMDFQSKYKPQGENDFFQDGRNSRSTVPGAVVRGNDLDVAAVFDDGYAYPVAENPPLYSGKNAQGEWYRGFPVEVDNTYMELGRKKYEIYCMVCHGGTGNGKGITAEDGSAVIAGKGYMNATPTYHSDRLRDMAEGEIFNTISHGKGLMGQYGTKLTPRERWAVIAYVRALQLSQNADVTDVPEQAKSELGL